MRIIGRECKKIFDGRLVCILILFSALFYQLFLTMPGLYSQMTEDALTDGLYRRIYREIGPAFTVEEFDTEIQAMRREMKKELDRLIQDDPVFAKAGLKDYRFLQDYRERLYEKGEGERTEREKMVSERLTEFEFLERDSAELIFQIQEIGRIREFKQAGFYGSDEKKAAELARQTGQGKTGAYQERKAELCMRRKISTLPDWIMDDVAMDMPRLAVMCMICCMVLLIPYQIRERIYGVIPLYLTAKHGRKLFISQALAVLFSASIVCGIQFLVYTAVAFSKGVFLFWDCPSSTLCCEMWSDLIFLQYYLLYLFLAWVFVLAVSLASYLISRSAGNHIAGIAAAIPAGTVAAMYGSWAFRYMDYLEYDRLLPSSVLICFLLLAVAVCAVLARERKGDVI